MIRIQVKTQADKEQLLAASRLIHDSNVDTDQPMVNTLAHLHQNPALIEVTDLPVYWLFVTKHERSAGVDARLQFYKGETTYKVLINGQEFGSGTIDRALGLTEYASTSTFTPQLKVPPLEDIVTCQMNTFMADGKPSRQLRLRLRYVNLIYDNVVGQMIESAKHEPPRYLDIVNVKDLHDDDRR